MTSVDTGLGFKDQSLALMDPGMNVGDLSNGTKVWGLVSMDLSLSTMVQGLALMDPGAGVKLWGTSTEVPGQALMDPNTSVEVSVQAPIHNHILENDL